MKNLNHSAMMAGLLGAGALLMLAALPAVAGQWHNPDIDETSFVTGTAGPEKGDGDLYGSILFDVGALQ